MLSAKDKYQHMGKLLNEKQWRQYLGTEALERDNISLVARNSGVAINTIKKGIKEIKNGDHYAPGGRIRAKGAGVKRIIDTDPTFKRDLEDIIEPKGDPMSPIRWTTRSLEHIVLALKERGHSMQKSALHRLLTKEGFSMKANKKNIEGISHPDRDQQFQHIKQTIGKFETSKLPIISIDCKKKELIGNFKNNGREWQGKGQNRVVNVYDFKNLSDGKAVPYGVYDVLQNTGFVNVGVDHDTAVFAGESVRRWWNQVGKTLYPEAKEILITSDGGGSNGVRNRLWKVTLQQISNETGLSITVTHLPPATSKWNKIEHRLFSFITINWRAKPLTSLETIIELLSHTTTKEGLKVTAMIDQNKYPTKIKVTDAQLATINIVRNSFHGEWNYTIKPQNTVKS
jgi:transposase